MRYYTPYKPSKNLLFKTIKEQTQKTITQNTSHHNSKQKHIHPIRVQKNIVRGGDLSQGQPDLLKQRHVATYGPGLFSFLGISYAGGWRE